MKRRIQWISLFTVLFALGLSGTAFAQKARMRTYHTALQKKMDAMVQAGQKCTVNLNDSSDGDGMDAEIRLTMGIREFEDFAPIAALEAAALPHKFPAVNIYWVYADSCGLKTAFLGNGGRNAATIFSLRYSSSR